MKQNKTLAQVSKEHWNKVLSSNYTYHVDLDERGTFKAHVESPDGKVVYSLSNEGELFETESGYMRHVYDMQGLTEYLISLQVIKPYCAVILAPGEHAR